MSLMTQIFGDQETFDPFMSMVNKCPVLSTPTDWKETPEAHVFVSDLPGLTKEDVKVEVEEGRVLKISGEWKVDEADKKEEEKWRRLERCRGKFLRRFRLPEEAKVDEVGASMEDGVLVVRVPKEQTKKPEKKKKVVVIEGN